MGLVQKSVQWLPSASYQFVSDLKSPDIPPISVGCSRRHFVFLTRVSPLANIGHISSLGVPIALLFPTDASFSEFRCNSIFRVSYLNGDCCGYRACTLNLIFNITTTHEHTHTPLVNVESGVRPLRMPNLKRKSARK